MIRVRQAALESPARRGAGSEGSDEVSERTAAFLAPTAMNRQKFRFERNGDKVVLKVSGFGFYMKIDLGIVKCHFELGSGKKVVV